MAGVAKATASAASPAAVVKALKVHVAITAPNNVKDIEFELFEDVGDRGRELRLRLVPAGLEELLPVLGPWPAVIVDEPRVRRSRLVGAAIGVEDVTQALDEREPLVRIVERCRSLPDLGRAQRPHERLGIVERRLV